MRSNAQKQVAKTVLTVGMAGAMLALVGCSSSGRNDGGRHSDIRMDATPEVLTLNQRPVDYDNTIFYSWNANGRMFWNDLMRATYNDRPSRLQKVPTPY